MEMDFSHLAAMLRNVSSKREEDLVVFLRSLSPSCQQELYQALLPQEDGTKKYACPVCHKRFKRRWNRDRHQKVHEAVAVHACPFRQCEEVCETGEMLLEHQKQSHGLDYEAARKRIKVGVRHGDHFDFLLPSGALLHIGEDGMEQHALEEADMHSHDHGPDEHCEDHVGQGVPISHGDHKDVLVQGVVHCTNEKKHGGVDVVMMMQNKNATPKNTQSNSNDNFGNPSIDFDDLLDFDAGEFFQ